MRTKLKMSAAVSAIAVTALSIQGLSPAMAADPVPSASPSPAATDDIDSPPAGDTEELVDVTIGEKTAPIELPLAQLADPLNALRINLTKSGYRSPPGDLYDGSAVGLYIDANVADVLKLTSRKVAAVYMPKSYRGGC